MRHIVRDPFGLVVESAKSFRHNDAPGVSAEAAYRLVIALPAVVILFTTVSSFVSMYTGVDAFQTLLDRARITLPFEVYSTLDLILTTVQEQSGFGIFSIGLAIALWSGSNAITALVKGLNRAHGVEDVRGWVRQRLISLGLLIGMGALVVASFALLTFGGAIRNEIGAAFGLGNEFNAIWNFFRWPILLLLFMAALAILYWVGPARRIGRRSLLPGAVVATVLWFIASYGFNIYLAVVDPGSAYGIVGSIIAVMLFLYISSMVVIFGAEINATVRRRIEGGVILAERFSHPLDLMSETIRNPVAGSRARSATWAVIGMLMGGALLGGILRRGSKSDKPLT